MCLYVGLYVYSCLCVSAFMWVLYEYKYQYFSIDELTWSIQVPSQVPSRPGRFPSRSFRSPPARRGSRGRSVCMCMCIRMSVSILVCMCLWVIY
jgi:cell division septal protein FtsQ